jgi:hypothetical protein
MQDQPQGINGRLTPVGCPGLAAWPGDLTPLAAWAVDVSSS